MQVAQLTRSGWFENVLLVTNWQLRMSAWPPLLLKGMLVIETEIVCCVAVLRSRSSLETHKTCGFREDLQNHCARLPLAVVALLCSLQ